jgi:hypothetical protein
VIAHGEVAVHGAKIALISLANVSAERIGHTEAAADEHMIIISTQKRSFTQRQHFPASIEPPPLGQVGKGLGSVEHTRRICIAERHGPMIRSGGEKTCSLVIRLHGHPCFEHIP